MEKLLKRNYRICPRCGKNLILEAPNYSNAPQIIRTNGARPYYATVGKFPTRGIKSRLFKYTSHEHRYVFPIPKSEPETSDDMNFEHGVYIAKAKRLIECDRIFNTDLVMFCKNCHANIALNRNPCRLIRYYWIYPMALACVSALVFQFIGYGLFLVWFGLAVMTIMLLISLVYYIIIKRLYSNFVIIDDWDILMQLEDNIKLYIASNRSLRGKNFFSESNIITISLNKTEYHLYITKSNGEVVAVHICGINGEQERILALIREKQKRGEKVILPLTFEGKFVGNAEVLETYDPPQSSNEER